MEWLKFKEEMCKSEIKFTKRHIMTLRAVTYLNIAIALFNGYVLYHQEIIHLFTALCTGVIIGNVFWSIAQLNLLKYDLKSEKEHLARIKELQDKDDYQDILKNKYEVDFRLFNKNMSNVVYPENKRQE